MHEGLVENAPYIFVAILSAGVIRLIESRWLFLLVSIVIVSGFVPSRANFSEYYWQKSAFLSVGFAVAYISFALPLSVALIKCLSNARVGPRLCSLLVSLTLIVGFALTFFSSALSGVGSLMVAMHGSVLTIGGAGAILSLSRVENRSALRLGAIGISIAALGAIWSLLSMVTVLQQANHLAEANPYCVAHHGAEGPIRAVSDLRGFSFYSTKSGWKISSRWYFHGLLVVGRSSEREYFNWSPRRMRFDRIEHPDRFFTSVAGSCIPEPDSLRTLNFY